MNGHKRVKKYPNTRKPFRTRKITKKQTQKAPLLAAEIPFEEESISEPESMDELLEMDGNEFPDIDMDSRPKETENEARLRIAKEVIRKKRRVMAERGVQVGESDDESDEEGGGVDLMNTVNAQIDFVGRSKRESLQHIFRQKNIVKEKDKKKIKEISGIEESMQTKENLKSDNSGQKNKLEILNKQIEMELQKDLLETQNRVFYPVFSAVEKEYKKSNNSLQKISLKAHKRPITACLFDPATQDLISVGKDGAILRHSFKQGFGSKTLISPGFPKDPNGHKDEILTADISFDGQFLITAGKDRLVRLWDLKSSCFLHAFRGHRGSITGVRFKDNSHDFVSLGEDRAMKLWDGQKRVFLETFYGHAAQPVSIDRLGGRFFVSSGYDATPIVWKIEQEKIMKFQKQLFSLGNFFILKNFRFDIF